MIKIKVADIEGEDSVGRRAVIELLKSFEDISLVRNELEADIRILVTDNVQEVVEGIRKIEMLEQGRLLAISFYYSELFENVVSEEDVTAGCLDLSLKPEKLREAIDTLVRDEKYIPGREIRGTYSDNGLTGRESEVLQLMSAGLFNKEIADKLGISERTVKNHVSNIFKKLDVSDRTQAVVYAIKNHIVNILG